MRFNSRQHVVKFPAMFSTDSAKALKAAKYSYLNGILYMSPARSGGVGNLCSHASPGCIALCLGLESGQASMVARDAQGNAIGTNSVRDSRKRKAQYFMRENDVYMLEMCFHVARLIRTAKRKSTRRRKLTLAIRPNGSTDIPYERIRFFVSEAFAAELSAIAGIKLATGLHTVFSLFHMIQFLDYTKNHTRFDKAPLPANYDLTFSLSETNEVHARALLARGINVAVCFAGEMPTRFLGRDVISGDDHDLRFLDPKTGVIVGLTPKGNKARRDTSGFVVRDAAARNAAESCTHATPWCGTIDLALPMFART